ncbi:hypothetical protein IB211_00632c [Intestinimonas butyriciproducens]|uniref:Uncharacterized protein n=1 Tax=Intestinimonas butyriciproducens TaxID=1297617 RepID=A0A0S2W0Y4_9FIRM|nr:hypothetical protein IB211_00632c [Intestinimonas butyriciproducens]
MRTDFESGVEGFRTVRRRKEGWASSIARLAQHTGQSRPR